MTTLPMTDEELAQHEQNYAGVEGSIEDRLFKYIHDLKGRLDKAEREAELQAKLSRAGQQLGNTLLQEISRAVVLDQGKVDLQWVSKAHTDYQTAYDAAVAEDGQQGGTE